MTDQEMPRRRLADYIRRRWWLFALGAALLLVAVTATATWLLTRDAFEYDEIAHRAAVEQHLAANDQRLTDWSQMRQVAFDVCESDDLTLTAAVFLDEGGVADYQLLGVHVQYVCPDRMNELILD